MFPYTAVFIFDKVGFHGRILAQSSRINNKENVKTVCQIEAIICHSYFFGKTTKKHPNITLENSLNFADDRAFAILPLKQGFCKTIEHFVRHFT